MAHTAVCCAVQFVDASSSMSIYTAIALTAMTQLITPTSADDFSLQVSQCQFVTLAASATVGLQVMPWQGLA